MRTQIFKLTLVLAIASGLTGCRRTSNPTPTVESHQTQTAVHEHQSPD